MRPPVLTAHDRPVPAAYWVATTSASVIVLLCFATARWLPWFVEDAALFVGPNGVDREAPFFVGLAVAALVVPACWLALRWPAFGIALAVLPAMVTVLDPRSAPLHFGVFAALCAVALTSAWRRPMAAVAAIGVALLVLLVWLTSGWVMAAPFAAEIDPRFGAGPAGVGTTYVVGLGLVLAFVLWFRSVAMREQQRRGLEARAGEVAGQAVVLAERARLARDLHDVVAHHVSLIAVRAETAPYTEPTLDDAGRRVLAEIAGDARLALDELRGVLGILGRADGASRVPQPTLADVAPLVERARGTGQDVTLDGDLGAPVGAAGGYAAYRVVQEALTNARRHAPGAPVMVAVTATSGLLEIRVSNAAPAASYDQNGGRGLIGMRERVDALGGRLRVRDANGTFELEATLPLGGTDVG